MNAIATDVGSTVNPEAAGRIAETPPDAVDRMVREVAAHKDDWVAMHLEDRVALLARLRRDTWAAAPELLRDALAAKGIAPGSPEEAEEWTAGPYALLRNLRLLERALRETRRYGAPRLPQRASTRPDGQVVARVFPTDAADAMLLRGYTAEVWMAPEVHLDHLADTQAGIYRDKQRRPQPGKVALVLGAGNVASIGPMDALYKLFAEDQVVVLKTNPVNDYVGRFVERAFAALIAPGFLRVVFGGADTGRQLTTHALVDEIHITGSDKTYDAIVFGAGAEGRAHKAAGRVVNPRRVSAELGNVTPVIVVPGPWSAKDLATQARNLVSGLANNAGFNCIAHRVIVQHAAWPQRRALLDGVRAGLARASTRSAWYPGAAERYAAFQAAHPTLERYGEPAAGELAWALVPDVDPQRADALAFTTEAFCGLFAETALAAATPAAFLRDAVDFVNTRLWGTLAAVILVHPDTVADPTMAQALDDAIAALRYGTVLVNHFPGLGYALGSTTWGAYPGHPATDIQSGAGVVHNTYLFDRAQKTVVRGPFRPFPTPPWWLGHRRALALARELTAYEAAPSLGRLLRLAWTGLRA